MNLFRIVPLPRRVIFTYVVATAVSFPILEILFAGAKARDFSHDVFDDGAVSRLGALRLDWSAFGPVLWNTHLTSGNAYFGQFNASPIALDGLLGVRRRGRRGGPRPSASARPRTERETGE